MRPFRRLRRARPLPGVGDEARGAEQVCRDESDRSRAAGAEWRAERAGLTLSEWVRDVLLGSSIETGKLAAERAILHPNDEKLSLRTPNAGRSAGEANDPAELHAGSW